MIAARSIPRTLVAALWLGATLAMASCFARPNPVARVDEPDFYSRDGIEFAYPSNWELFERVELTDDGEGEVRSISVGVEGQGGTYMRVLSPALEETDLAAFAERFKASLEHRYRPMLKLDRESEHQAEAEVAGTVRQGIHKELSFSFFLARLPLALDFYVVNARRMTIFLVTISMERSRRSTPGFDLILRSLRVFEPGAGGVGDASPAPGDSPPVSEPPSALWFAPSPWAL